MLQTSSLVARSPSGFLFLFLLCGLLPFAGLVLIAYHQTVEFFETKNQEQLRDLAVRFRDNKTEIDRFRL